MSSPVLFVKNNLFLQKINRKQSEKKNFQFKNLYLMQEKILKKLRKLKELLKKKNITKNYKQKH